MNTVYELTKFPAPDVFLQETQWCPKCHARVKTLQRYQCCWLCGNLWEVE